MRQFTLAEIAERIGGRVEGDASVRVGGVKPLGEAGPGELAVVWARPELKKLDASLVAAAVVPDSAAVAKRPLVRVGDAKLALARLLELFHAVPRAVTGIDPRAVVAPDAVIGRDVNIAAGAFVASGAEIGDRVDLYPGVFVGERARIGADSVLFANVSIYPDTIIGARVRIHSGAVIGSDGFGYTLGPNAELYKIPQVGHVEIQDDVEIGANSTVDRATMTRTVIGRGTKIDNLVQIGHNVELGEHVLLCAQSGIAGSARVGRYVVLAAGAGLADHVAVGDGARVGARAGAHKDIPAGTDVAGVPASPIKQFVKSYPLIAQLPEYRHRLKELEERCARLAAALEALSRTDTG